MQLLQFAPEIVVVVHHPHSLFSELHRLVAVTLVLDHLIRCFAIVSFLVSREDHSCM